MVVWMGTGGAGPSGLPRALSQQSGGEDQVLIKNCGVIKLLRYVFAEWMPHSYTLAAVFQRGEIQIF